MPDIIRPLTLHLLEQTLTRFVKVTCLHFTQIGMRVEHGCQTRGQAMVLIYTGLFKVVVVNSDE